MLERSPTLKLQRCGRVKPRASDGSTGVKEDGAGVCWRGLDPRSEGGSRRTWQESEGLGTGTDPPTF